MGIPLYLFLNRKIHKNGLFKIRIDYETSQKENVIYKIDSQHTLSKKYPFLFTECTAIGARSTFPCQV
jgi:leukotriene-A4 hydrolase